MEPLPPKTAKRRFLNVFLLAMLNMAIMASLRNLPLVAEYGLSSVFLYVIVAIAFLFPSALVSAELATGWTRTGGIYIWIREALGSRWGFFAVWMQWVHNVTWYPAILTFVATSIAYIFNPDLAENKLYILAVVLVSFWGMTIVNFFGLKISAWFSAMGVIIGTIIPGIFLIYLGMMWCFSGEPLQTNMSLSAIIPEFKSLGDVVFLAGMFLAFGGLEVNAVHAREVKDPQKNFPRAILLSAALTFIVFFLGSLAIAMVIPKEHISLVAGIMESFEFFLHQYHLHYLLPVIAIMIVIGAVGETNAWIIGPSKGLYATAKHGDLPPFLQKVNKRGVSSNLLIVQAIIVTISSCIIPFMPSTNAAFWILSIISAQIYLTMYVFMFIAAIRLRYTHPDVIRTYRIPHKHPGMWFVAGLGLLSSLFAFFIGFVPPSQIEIGNLYFYEGFLIIGLIVMWIIPHLIYTFKKTAWHQCYIARKSDYENQGKHQ